jgi:hypothetical protein
VSDTTTLAIFIVFGAIGLYNAWRAWHWTEIPEVLEGREYMIPMQIPGVIFWAAFPVGLALHAVFGNPADGSPLAVVVGSVAAAIALTGLVLAATTSFIGRPRRLIAPIARDRPGRARGPAERARDRRLRGWRRARRRSGGMEPPS